MVSEASMLCLSVEDGVEDSQKLSHAGDEGDLLGFAAREEPGIEGP